MLGGTSADGCEWGVEIYGGVDGEDGESVGGEGGAFGDAAGWEDGEGEGWRREGEGGGWEVDGWGRRRWVLGLAEEWRGDA